MIILIDHKTIHNLQSTATYKFDTEPIDERNQFVVRCDSKRVATGTPAIKLWDYLLSLVTIDLTKQMEEVTD